MMTRLKNKGKSIATASLMFAGIMIGLFIILNKTKHQKYQSMDVLHELEFPTPKISKAGDSFDALITIWKAQQRIHELMGKDSLSNGDSLEIKNIDKQLNQLIHD
jgi:hypothetical protein